MRKVFLLSFLLLLIIIAHININAAYASTAANTGLTGLWEYPTAEMPDDGVGRFGFTKASPYAFYFLDLAWLPWLEVNARFSTFSTRPAYSSPTARRYMDKAIDLKAILWHSKDPEKWAVPSIAFGVVDMMGTELMKAYYGVATWRWGNFALTLGYGSDRLNNLFGGFEWDIADWLTFKAEYSPLDYTQDVVGGRTVLETKDIPTKSDRYNFGVVLKTSWGMEGAVSWQRGSEVVLGISQRIDLNGPYLGKYKKNFETPGDPRIPNWEDTDQEELLSRIKSGLEKYTRVRDVDIKIEDTEHDGHKLTLAYENYGYSSHAEAMTRVLVVLAAIMPETTELLLIHKNAGVPVVQASFPGELLFDIRARSIRDEEPMRMAIFGWADSGVKEPDETVLTHKAQHEIKAMVVYEPRLDQTLRKAYMDRWDIDLMYTGRYSGGWGGLVDIRFPIYNNVDTANITGLWWEKDLNDDIRLQQAGLTYANKIGERTWFFGEGGWLDEEWFGANFWARHYDSSGRFWLGARLAAQHDRDPYSFAGLTDGIYKYYNGRTYDVDTDTTTDAWRPLYFVQAGYNIAGLDLDILADYGRFADTDKGYKISLVRHWDDTALGFYYIDTDKHAPNKDFTKAGIHMEIPAEKWFGTWFGNSSSHVWEQDTMILSTWSIESGREGGHIKNPERIMSQLRPVALKQNVEKLLLDYCSYDDGGENENEDQQEIRSILDYVFK